MTNATLQKMIADFGDRIFAINLDNTRLILVGYNSSTQLSDISFETISGTEFLVIHKTTNTHGKELKHKIYHVTDTVQWVGVMDEEYKDYRIDPLIIK